VDTSSGSSSSSSSLRRRRAPGTPSEAILRELEQRGVARPVADAARQSDDDLEQLDDARLAACALTLRHTAIEAAMADRSIDLVEHMWRSVSAHAAARAPRLLDTVRLLYRHAFSSREIATALWLALDGDDGAPPRLLVTEEMEANPCLLSEVYHIPFATVNRVATQHHWWTPGSVPQLRSYLDTHFAQARGATLLPWHHPHVHGAAAACGCQDDAAARARLRTSLAQLRSEIEAIGVTTGYASQRLLRAEQMNSRVGQLNPSQRASDEGENVVSAVVRGWRAPSRQLPASVVARLAEEQLAAVQRFAALGVMIVQGGAGSGKTEVGLAIAAQYDHVQWAAPTHAAKRNARTRWAARRSAFVPDNDASSPHVLEFHTLHALCGKLEFEASGDGGGGGGGGGDDARRVSRSDVIIADEASMIDAPLMAALLRHALRCRIKVLLLGDVNQLMPVGPGAPFQEFQTCEAVPMQVLVQNHRVHGKAIPELARRISAREDLFWTWDLPGTIAEIAEIADDAKQSITFHEADTDAAALAAMRRIVCDLQQQGVVPAAEADARAQASRATAAATLRVIAPGREHAATYARVVRDIYRGEVVAASASSSASSSSSSALRMRTGDVVLFSSNREFYRNGDLGIVQSITPATAPRGGTRRGAAAREATYRVRIIDTDARMHATTSYPESSAANRNIRLEGPGLVALPTRSAQYELTLAYATTVHKSQGQEADHVIVMLPATTSRPLRNFKLTYTAVTRARQHVYLIGPARGVGECMRNRESASPTALSQLLAHARRVARH